MSYDIRYKIGDLVDLVNDEAGRNPWRVACIFIHGDEGIVDESQRVSYNLVSLAGDAGRGAFNHEIRPNTASPTKMHKIYLHDPEIVEMVRGMSPEEKEDLARKFEGFLGWDRGDGPGVRFNVVEDE